jgi:hypothetical protein
MLLPAGWVILTRSLGPWPQLWWACSQAGDGVCWSRHNLGGPQMR